MSDQLGALTRAYTERRIDRRKFLQGSLALGLSVSTAFAILEACNTSNSPSGPSTLTIWDFDVKSKWQYNGDRIAAFIKDNPTVKVTYEHSVPPVGSGGYEDKINTSLATNSAPDIFGVINPQAPVLISRNQLSPIDDSAAQALGYTSTAALKAATWPGALASWSDSKGSVYGWPWEVSWLNLYVNAKHLQAGGVDPKTVSVKTWDDLVQLGNRVVANNQSFYKNSSGKWIHNFFKLPMYADDTWSMQVLTTFLAQTGGSVLSADGKSSTITSPQSVKAVKTMIAVSRQLGDPNIGQTVPGSLFASYGAEDLSCVVSGPWLYRAFLQGGNAPAAASNVVLGMPMIDQPGNVYWGWTWSVNHASQNKALAWKLIGYLQLDPQINLEAQFTFMPINGVEAGWAAAQIPQLDVELAARNGAQPIFASTHYAAIAHILRGKIELMAFQGADVDSTLQQAAKEINTELGA